MATATQNEQPAATNDDSTTATSRAPAFKRPEGISDLEWSILSVAKNEDMVARIMAIWRGDIEPTPEEAALMLEVTKSAEMKAFKSIRRLQAGIAPKLASMGIVYSTLTSISSHLFGHATKSA